MNSVGKSKEMDSLIGLVNQLHLYKLHYHFNEIHFPEIIVIGSQSSGKSSVLERIINYDILPKNAKLATKCPILLQMKNEDDSSDKGYEIKAKINDKTIQNPDNIYEHLKQLMISNEKISEKQIVVQLFSRHIPTLTMIDIPGIITNDHSTDVGSAKRIKELTRNYAENKNAIILAVSAANVDLSNCVAIEIAKEFDPEGKRTFHILTKVDIKDQGTSVKEMLEDELIQNSLKNICVVNRSQKAVDENVTMAEITKYETEYFSKNYPDLQSTHGIEYLKETLTKALTDKITQQIFILKNEVNKKSEFLKDEIKEFDVVMDDDIRRKILKFTKFYKNYIKGNHGNVYDKIVGGAKIRNLLYETYDKNIKELKPKNDTEEIIRRTINNTRGNQPISYSNERPIKSLAIIEIEQFRVPTHSCLCNVRDHLITIVNEVINEEIKEIEGYEEYFKALRSKMNDLIEKHFNITKLALENFINTETKDILCSEFIISEERSLNTSLVKDTDQIKTSNPSEEKCSNLKKISNPFEEKCTSLKQISNPSEEKCTSLKQLKEENKKPPKDENSIPSDDVQCIKNKVENFFKEARLNVRKNVPKHIQVLFITGVLEDLPDFLFSILKIPEVMTRSNKIRVKVETMKNELQSLEDISKTLSTLNS